MSVDLPAPLWPTTPTHSPAIAKIGAVQSPDGAVGFFDADEIDEKRPRSP